MTISSPNRSLSSVTDSMINETTDSERPQEDTLPTFLPGHLSFETQQNSEGFPLMIRRTAPFDPNPPVGMRPSSVTIANGDTKHYWWVTKGWKMLIEIQQKTKMMVNYNWENCTRKGETLLCFRWSCPDGWSQNMVERLLRMRRPPSKSWGFKS